MDGLGNMLRFLLLPGQAHDMKGVAPLIHEISFGALPADKTFDADWLLQDLDERSATGQHEFDTLCAALNIEHRLTPPRSPQTNGMVERFNGRIEDVLQSHHFRSGEELETTLHRYVWLYNQQLPQSALQSKTPVENKRYAKQNALASHEEMA